MTVDLEHLIQAPTAGWSTAAIEFTSKCNLRCSFCTLSHPDYVGKDAAPETIETIKRLLAEGDVQSVSISGHGETTIFPNWEHHARELLQAGQALTTITNLAKVLSDEEARAFSCFSEIRVSVDSPDREQLKQMRRKVDLRTILHNIHLIRGHALADYRPGPDFHFTCVLFFENSPFLARLVALAGSCSATLHLQNPTLVKGLKQPEDAPLTPLNSLNAEQKKQAFEHIVDAYQLGKTLNVQVTADPMLEAQFDERVASSIEEVSLEFDDPNSEGSLEFINITTRSKSGHTRLCLEPWSYMLFAQNGEVFSCCVGYPTVAKLDKDSSLEDIYNSPGNQQVRRELLTGELTEHCATCPRKANVSVEELRGHVSEFLRHAKERAAGSPRLPVVPPAAVGS